MHCHGHNRVPGVTPERDQRPKARQPTSVAQRRGAAHYRTITTAVSWRLAGERADRSPNTYTLTAWRPTVPIRLPHGDR
jgi:hypothetical protein